MNAYEMTLDYLRNMPVVQEWDEIWMILQRTGEKEPRDWRLPGLACEAVGGLPDIAIPATASIACLQISIILIDDILDEDPRGEYRRIGTPAAAHLATAFQAIGLDAIENSRIDPNQRLLVVQSLNQMILSTALGQYLDIQNPNDEANYWKLVKSKSSPFFGAALYSGAVLGGAESQTANQIERFGKIYGEMIQVHDDLNDAMAIPANPDWTQARASLPMLFAKHVNHPDKTRFLELRQQINKDDSLAEAQMILIRSGAVSYCVDQLIHRYRIAREILNTAVLVQSNLLEDLLNDVIDPVRHLFSAIGVSEPEINFPPLSKP